MQLATYLSGRAPRLGAVWHDAMLDLRNLSMDMAAQRQARPTREALLPASMIELTLEPGAILATSTPSGVGAVTGAYLEVGDLVEAEIDGLGSLGNRVVAAGGV